MRSKDSSRSEQIDDYLLGKLDGQALQSFTAMLENDQEFRAEFEERKLLITVIRKCSENRLRQNINLIAEAYESSRRRSLWMYRAVAVLVVMLTTIGIVKLQKPDKLQLRSADTHPRINHIKKKIPEKEIIQEKQTVANKMASTREQKKKDALTAHPETKGNSEEEVNAARNYYFFKNRTIKGLDSSSNKLIDRLELKLFSNPHNSETYIELARIYIAAGDSADAHQNIEEAIKEGYPVDSIQKDSLLKRYGPPSPVFRKHGK